MPLDAARACALSPFANRGAIARRGWLSAWALAGVLGCQGGPPPASPAARPVRPSPAQSSAAGTEASQKSNEAGALRQWTLRNGLVVEELVTAQADPESALPMIVAIHGLGDDPAHFSSLLAQLDVPARVVFPRGLDPHEEGWSWFPIRARDADVDGLSAGIAHAADLVWAGVQELKQLRPTRGRPILTGFSQGGMLATAIAVRHGDGIAAAYPVGGWLPPPLWPVSGDPALSLPGPPIVEFHGDADKAVLFGPTNEAIEHLKSIGANASLIMYPGVGHQITPELQQDLVWRIKQSVAEQAQLPAGD